MKKTLFLIGAACLFAVGAKAQVSYGVKAGVNLPKQVVKLSGSGATGSVDVGSTTSFYVSGYANIPAATNFSIQPGIALQGKGGKLDFSEFDMENTTQNILSLDIPINAVYTIPAGQSGAVFIGAGPYVGYHLSGKVKQGDQSLDMSFGDAPEDVKRFDYGANFQLGYKLSNGFLIHGNYGLGLADLTNFPEVDNLSIKGYNRVLSFGIGYEF